MTAMSTRPSSGWFTLSGRAESLPQMEPRVHGYRWRHPAPKASVILLHGLRSHAGWFAHAADGLVERGFAVYTPDRRGSGSSPEARGDIARFDEWFEEVAAVVDLARKDYPRAPVHLLGHCFGGNIAMGTGLAKNLAIESLIVLTPGLFLLPDYTAWEKVRIGVSSVMRPEARFPVPFEDDLFTRTPEVLDWILQDRIGARTLTARCLLQIREMTQQVLHGTAQLQAPLLVLEADRDRIADNRRSRAHLERALGDWPRFKTFEGEHFLLAEPCCDEVLDAIDAWVSASEWR
jgi:alpha-beta hydrolase superfamily lysophospholipase